MESGECGIQVESERVPCAIVHCPLSIVGPLELFPFLSSFSLLSNQVDGPPEKKKKRKTRDKKVVGTKQ